MAVRRIRNGNGLTFESKELPDRHTVGPVNERRLKAAQGENKLMKLMKHIMIALVLCAIPAVAFGQNVVCDDCDHIVPYYKGNGGFVGMMTAGAEKVTFVAECDNVTTTGTADVNADGLASMLFNDMNGLACDTDNGSMQVAGLEDGAWYWITDDMNSAVGSLVNKAVLDNDMTMPADPGSDDIVMTPGQGAYFLKQVSTGRVGILSTIMAEPPADPLKKCGFSGAASSTSPASPVQTECALGDGGTTLLMTSTNAITGATVRIMDKGSVTRPGGTGTVTIVADLWGNGSGHYVATHDAATANGISAMRGQQAVAMSAARAATRYTGVSYGVSVSGGGPEPAATVTSGTAVGGVDYAEAANAATITVGASSEYCSNTSNYTATVTVTASMTTATDADQVVPSIARSSDGVVGGASFTVMCPAASANQGQELVPENPFPTE